MRRIKISFLMLLVANFGYGQSSSPVINYEQTIIPPSPNAAALAKYIDYPVSFSTGLPEISIPIYTLTSKRLSVPVSISYHAGGIKVSDKTFNMGAGWTLNAGGAVSRVVKDIPDESANGFFNTVYPDEDGSINTSHKDFCLSNHLIDLYTDGTVKYDGEPDLFYYTAGDLSGSFVFRNRTVIGVDPLPATMPFSPIKIIWNHSDFTITDLNGNIYRFGNVTNSKDYTTSLDPPFQQYGPITQAWYVTKITSADKTDSVSFTYELNPQTSTSSLISTTGILSYPQIGPPTATTATVVNGGSNTSDQTVRIKEITGTSGKIDFTYTTDRLSSIDIYKSLNSVFSKIKSFQVAQSQFSSSERTRLDSIKETGYINNVATITNPPYKFSYYSQDAPHWDSKDQDFWGFYNGKGNTDMLYVTVASTGSGTNTTFVPAVDKRSIDTLMLQKGSLTRVTYPTGGYTDFLMEPNQILQPTITTTTIPQSVTHHISTFYLLPNDPTTGVSLTFTPNAKLTSQVKLDFTGVARCTPSGSCPSNIPEVKLFDVTSNTQIADIFLTDLFHNTVTSQEQINYYPLNTSHQYKIYFPTPGTITYAGEPTQYRLDAVLTEQLPDSIRRDTDYQHLTKVLAGGLRIKQIKHNDNAGNTIIKTYNYTKSYYNSNAFRGDFNYILDNFARDKYAVINYGGPVRIKTSRNYSEGLNVPIGGTSNSSVSYQEVEEVLTGSNGSTLGKNVYTYNTAMDFISNMFPTTRFPKDYIRSQLIDLKTYKTDSQNNLTLIKEVVNNFNNINEAREDAIGLDSVKLYLGFTEKDYSFYLAQSGGTTLPNAYQSVPPPYITSLGCPVYPSTNGTDFHLSPFYYHVVRPLLISTIATSYDTNGLNPIASETDYAYDNLQHMQPTRVTNTNSDQKVNVLTTKYPLDYSYRASCNMQACVTSFNQQLATLKLQRGQCQLAAINSDNINDGTAHNNALSAYDQCEATFNTGVNTLVTQYNTCVAQFQQCYTGVENSLPASDKAIAFMQDKNLVTPKIDVIATVDGNPTGRTKTDYQITDIALNIVRPQQINVQIGSNPIEARANFFYDPTGNLSDQSLTNGPTTSYQWGYNGQYPVAQFVNTKSKNAFFESFEDGAGNSTVDDAETGHYSHTGTYSKTLSGLDNGAYVLTYWQKNSSTWILQTSAITVSSSSYTISVNAQVDDIRFYPGQAQMTTYTYDPLIGITSMTDVKNQTTYYEYDALQRLINIKDKDRNVVKHTDYHYQGQ